MKINRRMKKEFKKVGLIYNSMDDIYNQIYYRPENDMSQHVVDITDQFIICVWSSETLDSKIMLYDHAYNLIATQYLYPDSLFSNKWFSYIFGEDER